jgi:hypothetical protein
VHDVAFPRLNSAAFWFLPGGLIMLCQLVCTDRRYARMNCFNIRELQGILKRRFFTDLVNSHDHRSLLSTTMIGAKFKMSLNDNINQDITIFYNWGTHDSHLHKNINYSSSNNYFSLNYSNIDNFLLNRLNFFLYKVDLSLYLSMFMSFLSFHVLKLFHIL